MDPRRPCEMPGPMVRTSPQYVSQVWCNRTAGHPGPHRNYDPQTFHVVAEWDTAHDPDQPKKRIR